MFQRFCVNMPLENYLLVVVGHFGFCIKIHLVDVILGAEVYKEEFLVYKTILFTYTLEFETRLYWGERYFVYILVHTVAIKARCKQEVIACVISQHSVSWIYVLYATVIPTYEVLLEGCNAG